MVKPCSLGVLGSPKLRKKFSVPVAIALSALVVQGWGAESGLLMSENLS